MKDIKIGPRTIGANHAPFIIAEMSGNHNQSLERALTIVDAAARTGAHALKLQTYTADSMTIDLSEGEFLVRDPKSLWNGRTLYDLYREAATPYEWHEAIFQRCRERNILCFSTPFDSAAVDFLETLNAPAYKVASFENTDIPLIQRIARSGKPMIMSTGMASMDELDESVQAARAAGCESLVLLKCTSSYPASPENTNLRTIPHMRDRYQTHVGLSDHTMGVGAAAAAVAFGATVIEKHFTLARADGGVDSAFSLEPLELKELVVETERAWRAVGEVKYGPSEQEMTSLKHRRSLYIVNDIPTGGIITTHNVRAIRPAGGLPPKFMAVVIGKRAVRDLKRGTPLSLEHLE